MHDMGPFVDLLQPGAVLVSIHPDETDGFGARLWFGDEAGVRKSDVLRHLGGRWVPSPPSVHGRGFRQDAADNPFDVPERQIHFRPLLAPKEGCEGRVFGHRRVFLPRRLRSSPTFATRREQCRLIVGGFRER